MIYLYIYIFNINIYYILTKNLIYIYTLINFNNSLNNICILIFLTFFIVNTKHINLLILGIYFFNKYFINFITLFLYGFFKFHTLLFYISIIFFNNLIKKNTVYLKLKTYWCFYLSIISFLLGSLWSLYLYTWGYYWLNDSIEYILIFYSMLYFLTLHTFNKISIINKFHIIIITIILILLRNNFLYTKHNFFNSFNKSKLLIKYSFLIFIMYIYVINYNYKIYIIKYLNYNLLRKLLYIIICVNYLNFKLIQQLLYNIFILLILFTIYTLNWFNINYLKTHLIFFIFILLYNLFINHFLLNLEFKFFYLTQQIKIYKYTYITNNFYYYFKQYMYIYINKYENLYNAIQTNNFLIKKYLLN